MDDTKSRGCFLTGTIVVIVIVRHLVSRRGFGRPYRSSFGFAQGDLDGIDINVGAMDEAHFIN